MNNGKKESVLRTKSYAFGVRIVRLSQYLVTEHKEYVLSKQILRSGTAIGALVREAEYGISKAEFRSKMSIAFERSQRNRILALDTQRTDYINDKLFNSLSTDCVELIKMLIATVKTTRKDEPHS